jgi:predicted RNA-binding Zn-ribbon protein involved in translation (DUF1610 family)
MEQDSSMHGDRVACPVCGCSVERAKLSRHQGSKICLAFKSKREEAKADSRKPIEAKKASNHRAKVQRGGFRCPHCGYDYEPFVRPFFEKFDKEFLELDYASCFQRLILRREAV